MRTVKEKLSLCRLYSSLLDHKDSFPLHFNLRFNPDNCSCLTRHWQLAALSSFKNTSSRRSWDEASLAHSLVVMCFTKCSWCIVGELTVSSDDVFDSFLLIGPFVSCLLVAVFLFMYVWMHCILPLRPLWFAQTTAGRTIKIKTWCLQTQFFRSKTGKPPSI